MPATKPPPTPTRGRGCTHFKLRQLGRALSRHYDAFVAAEGLKTTQYSLLSHVLSLGPIRPGALAARMHLEPSTLTRNLQPLVAGGWVELGPGPDARSRLVQITEAGRAKHARVQQAWKQAQLALNARLGLPRVEALHALIADCMHILDEPETDDE